MEEKIKDIEEFLKEAFCVDGECKKDQQCSVLAQDGKHTTTPLFKITDNKRGTFYVAIVSDLS
jgi:hypothetical protein